MKKYLTWRCIGLHALALVLVPAFLAAGWWQYHVALGGNDLSWVYTVEWPFFAVYAVYIWWKLIHDQSTPFDRLWAARQRAAADEEGRPLHDIPGWAMDKALTREVRQASLEAARSPALATPRPSELDVRLRPARGALPAVSGRSDEALNGHGEGALDLDPVPAGDESLDQRGESVIDARVLEVKVTVDEELDAYNRYLFELSTKDPPKRWGPRRSERRRGPPDVDETPNPTTAGRPKPVLPSVAGDEPGM